MIGSTNPPSATSPVVATELPNSAVNRTSQTPPAPPTAPTQINYERLIRAASSLKIFAAKLQALIDLESRGSHQVEPEGPPNHAQTATAPPPPSPRFPRELDKHGLEYLLTHSEHGTPIGLLLQELVTRGYRRLHYAELASLLLPLQQRRLLAQVPRYLRSQPSDYIFYTRDGDGRRRVITDPASKVRLFQARCGRGAALLVTQFRAGEPAEYVLNLLRDLGYVPPSACVFDAIIAANGMSRADARVDNFDDCDPYEGRVWDDIVVPAGLLRERKAFDRAAAVYIVQLFRAGDFAHTIMEDLECLGYELPCWEVFDGILAANGLCADNELALLEGEVVGEEEGRDWSCVVIPEGIFEEEA